MQHYETTQNISSSAIKAGMDRKTHCLCAIARELILRHQTSVWFTPAFKRVQQLLQAKEDLRLPEAL